MKRSTCKSCPHLRFEEDDFVGLTVGCSYKYKYDCPAYWDEIQKQKILKDKIKR
jgi:hypothetical protein